MSIISNAFGRVTLTDSDAKKFAAQATYGRPKATAHENVAKGIALSQNIQKSGSVRVRLKEPA